MKISDLLTAIAVLLSALAIFLPVWASRPKTEIVEVLTVPTWKYATWVYIVVTNRSTFPVLIYGATLDGVRVYRHQHYFADRGKDGKQYSTKFPILIPANSGTGILIEFDNPEHTPFNRDTPLKLVLTSDRKDMQIGVVINQQAVEVQQALREI
jgi:hypothetical protein